MRNYCLFVSDSASRTIRRGTYCGAPAIFSSDCTNEPLLRHLDGGMSCACCLAMGSLKGGSNPGTKIDKWNDTFMHATERAEKSELTLSDIRDCNVLIKKKNQLNEYGKRLLDQVSLRVTGLNYLATCLLHILMCAFV